MVSWTGSVQGPYPVGNPSAQPDQKFAFPDPATGARDQTFRLMVRPDLWGRQARIRLSNAFGNKPVTFDGVHVGLQSSSAALVRGSNRPVTFGGKPSVTVPPGGSAWSDPVALPFVKQPDELAGRRLAVSFHVAGDSGPMTWHAKALTTSYVTAPGAGAKGALEDESAFPYTTASWFFLDAVEMTAPTDAFAIMAFGDSITDGTASTMNGDDRWPDVLSRRLKALHGNKVAVVNGGIGGNQIAGPAEYGPDKPFPGGPASGQRLDRDVLALSGISSLIWLEGINDFSKNGNASTDQVIAAMKDGVDRLRKKWPQLRVIGATVTTRARQFQRRARFPGAGRQAEGAQRVHPHIRHVRRRDRFRQGGARSAVGRPQAGIRPREHHRRPRRQASPQPHRLSGDGPGDRSRSVQAGPREPYCQGEGLACRMGGAQRYPSTGVWRKMMGFAQRNPSYNQTTLSLSRPRLALCLQRS